MTLAYTYIVLNCVLVGSSRGTWCLKSAQQHVQVRSPLFELHILCSLCCCAGRYDKNGDGTLSESEFNAALVGSGIQLNKDDAKKFFKKVDASGDDVVDYKVCFMASSAGCAARSAFLGGSSMHLYLVVIIWLKIDKLRP